MNLNLSISEEAAAVLAELRRMAGASGKLRTSSCLPKLTSALGLPRISINEAVRDLYRARLLSYQADGQELPASGYITVVLESVAPDPKEVAWINAMDTAGIGKAAAGDLSSLACLLNGMPQEDLAALACGLQRLSEEGPSATDDAGFNVSARYLMGSSKVLSMMSVRMLEALRLPIRLRNPSPRYVICAGPPDPVATLLIENPQAFENAVRSGLSDEVALICTYGFGLSYLGHEWLHAIDTSEVDQPILIVRKGSPPPLSNLLRAPRVFLWGDLDLAAISIYKALKRAVPQLHMSRIYEAMMPMIHDSNLSHPYAEIFDKGDQGKGIGIDTQSSHDLDSACLALRNACKTRAVDQEAVPNSAIRSLGGLPLTFQ